MAASGTVFNFIWAFFGFLVCIFSKIFSGKNVFSQSRFVLFLALFSGIVNFHAQNHAFFHKQFLFFLGQKKETLGKGGSYDIVRGAGGDEQADFLKKNRAGIEKCP